jgi:hypothetical protein
MSMDEYDKDIRRYGPCLRPYYWHGGGDGDGPHRLGSCGLQHRKPLIQREVAMKESSASFHGRSAVKAEKFEGNREARQALALSAAGVMALMLIWNLIMLLSY